MHFNRVIRPSRQVGVGAASVQQPPLRRGDLTLHTFSRLTLSTTPTFLLHLITLFSLTLPFQLTPGVVSSHNSLLHPRSFSSSSSRGATALLAVALWTTTMPGNMPMIAQAAPIHPDTSPRSVPVSHNAKVENGAAITTAAPPLSPAQRGQNLSAVTPASSSTTSSSSSSSSSNQNSVGRSSSNSVAGSVANDCTGTGAGSSVSSPPGCNGNGAAYGSGINNNNAVSPYFGPSPNGPGPGVAMGSQDQSQGQEATLSAADTRPTEGQTYPSGSGSGSNENNHPEHTNVLSQPLARVLIAVAVVVAVLVVILGVCVLLRRRRHQQGRSGLGRGGRGKKGTTDFMSYESGQKTKQTMNKPWNNPQAVGLTSFESARTGVSAGAAGGAKTGGASGVPQQREQFWNVD